VLLLLEHPHVYTLGRRGPDTHILAPPEDLARLSAKVYRTDRGGEATYHGPGQLVGYPIVDLRSWGLGPLQYVRTLERTIAAALADFGIDAASDGYPTGVWTGGAKIAAIGVRVSRGVTTHGFALNVAPDLGYFDHIVPCGIEGCQVTSMAAEGAETDIDTVAVRLADQFQQSFGISLTPTRLEQLEVG
jgi:lipoate-protein ligase B